MVNDGFFFDETAFDSLGERSELKDPEILAYTVNVALELTPFLQQ